MIYLTQTNSEIQLMMQRISFYQNHLFAIAIVDYTDIYLDDNHAGYSL